MTLEQWEAQFDRIRSAEEAVFPGEISEAQVQTTPCTRETDPSAFGLAPSTGRNSRPVRPIPAVCSWQYERASLGEKFRAATRGTIPAVLPIQRQLLAMIRTPDFDPWAASLLLVRIETHVRESWRRA